jgi:hypothetical protein
MMLASANAGADKPVPPHLDHLQHVLDRALVKDASKRVQVARSVFVRLC